MDQFDCSEFVAINGKAIQVVIWCGNEVPDSLIPLDGRIVNGIALPDHRDKFLCTKSEDSDEELIARVNTWLIDILGEPGSLTIGRITRVTEEIQDGVKEPGFVCVWID